MTRPKPADTGEQALFPPASKILGMTRTRTEGLIRNQNGNAASPTAKSVGDG